MHCYLNSADDTSATDAIVDGTRARRSANLARTAPRGRATDARWLSPGAHLFQLFLQGLQLMAGSWQAPAPRARSAMHKKVSTHSAVATGIHSHNGLVRRAIRGSRAARGDRQTETGRDEVGDAVRARPCCPRRIVYLRRPAPTCAPPATHYQAARAQARGKETARGAVKKEDVGGGGETGRADARRTTATPNAVRTSLSRMQQLGLHLPSSLARGWNFCRRHLEVA